MPRKISIFCSLFLFALSVISTGLSQNNVKTVFSDCVQSNTTNLTVVSRAMVGNATCVEVSENYAYLGTQNALLIFDVSQPQEPVLLFQEFTCDPVIDIAVSGNYAYVLCLDLLVYDVSNPRDPIKVNIVTGATSIFPHAYMDAQKLEIEDGYLYIAGGYSGEHSISGLCILDISNPEEPQHTGAFYRLDYQEGDLAQDVCIVGDKAYIAFASGQGTIGRAFWIVDISDKSNPTPLGHYDPGVDIFSVEVYKNYAFIGGDWGVGLLVLDVSDPTSPQFSHQLPDYFSGVNRHNMAIHDSLLYLSAFDLAETGLKVFDISRPDSVKLVYTFDKPLDQIKIVNSTLYATNGGQGLFLFDNAQPTSPQLLQNWRCDGGIKNVWVYDDYAYVQANDLTILDISDKQKPERVGRFSPSHSTIDDLLIKDGVLFLAGNRPYGFSTYDVSDFDNIKQIDFLELNKEGTRWPHVTDLAGDQAIVLLDTALFIYDISDPANLHQVGKIEIIDAKDAVLGDGYIGLANKNRVKIFDISDLENIHEASDLTVQTGNTFDLYIVENTLYFFSEGISVEDNLNIVDVSDIYNPLLLNSHPIRYCIYCSERNNEHFIDSFFYSADVSSLNIYNISNPLSIDHIGEFKLRNHWSRHIYAEDDYIYLPNAGGSLYIIKVDPKMEVQNYKEQPASFSLRQNYPNPFNSQTTISYYIDTKDQIKLSIYDLMGREVITLVDHEQQQGLYKLKWDGKDRYGNMVPSSVYFYTLQTSTNQFVRKMIILR